MHWDDLHTLATLVRGGNYSACARELGLTHATVIRRLKRLEQALQMPLTVPSSAGLQLSPAGLIALEAARQMESSAERVLRELEATAGTVAGSLRITATESLGTRFLTPRLGSFHEMHPKLRVELVIDNRNLSLARRKAHIAVRLNRPQEEQLVAKRVARMTFGVYAARKLATKLRGAEPQSALPFCQLEASDGDALPEARWVAEHVPRSAITYVSNSLNGVVAAAREGLGAAVLPNYLAPEASLVLLRELPEVTREVWVAYPPEYRKEARFQAGIDWLVETFQRDMR